MRPFFDGGLVAAIPNPAVRERTLTVSTDVRRAMAAAQIPSAATISLLLVVRSRCIFWRAVDTYHAERAVELERAHATLSR